MPALDEHIYSRITIVGGTKIIRGVMFGPHLPSRLFPYGSLMQPRSNLPSSIIPIIDYVVSLR